MNSCFQQKIKFPVISHYIIILQKRSVIASFRHRFSSKCVWYFSDLAQYHKNIIKKFNYIERNLIIEIKMKINENIGTVREKSNEIIRTVREKLNEIIGTVSTKKNEKMRTLRKKMKK